MKVDDSEILTIECPYTSCAAGVGTVCTNARNGKPMPHSHKDRLRAWADRENRLANAGHEIAMSYNAWQIVRLVACSMVCDLDADQPEGWSEAREAIHRLLDELPCLNWGNPVAHRGRVHVVRPRHHRQRFRGSRLATLRKVMSEAADLKGGAFDGPRCMIKGQLDKIPTSAVDQLASLG